MRRLLRLATVAALGRAWNRQSRRWLAVALGLVGLRTLDRHATNVRAAQKASRRPEPSDGGRRATRIERRDERAKRRALKKVAES